MSSHRMPAVPDEPPEDVTARLVAAMKIEFVQGGDDQAARLRRRAFELSKEHEHPDADPPGDESTGPDK